MYNSRAQNPNWALPGNQYNHTIQAYTSLPQSPIHPVTNNPITDPNSAYQGEPATYSSAGYTGPDGELLLFTVDESVYDKNGWMVGKLRRTTSSSPTHERQGYSEVLILPMGNSCTKFAIIFPSSAQSINGPGQYSTSAQMRIYMAIYDIEATNYSNDFAEYVTGALDGDADLSGLLFGTTLTDISRDYALNHYDPNLNLYQMNSSGAQSSYIKGYQIAASELIDNCYRYVLICDGASIIRYRLTTDGLEYDNYSFFSGATGSNNALRSEMELIKLSNNNYRLAIPMQNEATNPTSSIRIFDLDPNMELIPGSSQIINLTDANFQRAEPNGLEFDQTGRYLYFTHKPNADYPSTINVWDVQSNAMASVSFPSSFTSFELSYIERFGANLYLAKANKIGVLTNASNPFPLTFNDNLVTISGYGNDANLGTSRLRYQLPDQVDDGNYGDFDSYSCECCSRWGTDATSFTATGTQTWTPVDNPLNNGTGAEVRIYDELRIAPGANITIDGMVFKFDPEARVVVQKGNGTANGGILKLRNSTIFTADLTCKDGDEFISCGEPDNDETCDRDFWQGIVVEGKANMTQSISGATQQGRLIMETNSMVEYARTAVLVGNTSNVTDGGGVVRITDSRFKDNINGIYFRPYLRMSGGQELYTLSNITMSEFYTTADFLTLSPAVPGRFIDVRGISGLYLYANTFENQVPSSFGFTQRGTGMYISDSRVQDKWFCTGSLLYGCPGGTINRSIYKNLTLGIDGINTTSIRTVYIYHAIFQNNFTNGIRLSKYQNPEILDNDFYIGWYAGIGLSMTGCTGYKVENNTFQDFQGGLYGRGIVVQDSGTNPNEIYRNTFTSLAQGIVTQGVNAKYFGDNHPDNDLDVGLKILCNTFDQPVRNHDIYLASGSISDDQGNCFGQTTDPAGNLFSHSHTSYASHYDWRVNTSLVLSGLEVVYRHHSPLSTPTELRLKPIVYTPGPPDYIQPVACTIAYGGYATSCPVKNTSMQYGITGGPKSNDISEETIFTPEYISAQATELDAAINEAEAYLDGGNTWQLLSLIASGGETDEIATLVEEAGESISVTVINRLQKTGDEELSILASSALIGVDMASSIGTIGDSGEESALNIALPSSSIEAAWKTNRKTRDVLWTDATRAAMSDTLGNLLPNDILELANVHHPKTIGRYVASVALSLGEAVPSWISDQDDPFFTNFGSVSLPSTGESDSLPSDIPDHFIQSSFAFNGNLTAINEMYVANGQSYNVYTIPFEEEDLGKNNNAKAQKDAKAMEMERITVQPNPFDNQLMFKLSNIDEPIGVVRIELFDLLGRKVFSQEFGGDSHTLIINDSRIPKGVLMYVVFTDDKPLQNGKIIKM
jgi:hypothetical protein